MPQVSYVARAFIESRLIDSSTGLNHWLAIAAPDYELQPFTLATGTNVFRGALSPKDIAESGYDASWPYCTVWGQRAANSPGRVTPSVFSGDVITIVDFYTGFESEEPPPEAEPTAELIEDAMFETFNRAEYYGLPQGFASEGALTYNNDMIAVRGPLGFGGKNWIQQIRFTITHQRLTAGR